MEKNFVNKEHSSPLSCTNGDPAGDGEWSARRTRNLGPPGSSPVLTILLHLFSVVPSSHPRPRVAEDVN